MPIRSYFAVKKRDVLKGEREKVTCSASMAESVKAESLKHTTEEKADQLRRKGALIFKENITTENKVKIRKYAAENAIGGRLK